MAISFTTFASNTASVPGFTLISSPLWGAVFLWWFLAIALIVLGVLNVLRAITGRKG